MEKYYVSGVTEQDGACEMCADEMAKFWTVYVRDEQVLSQGIIDLTFREDAEAAMAVYVERDALQQQVNALAVERAAIKSAFKDVHSSTEEAELYGDLKYMVEPSEYEALADAVEETPATDAAIRELQAQGLDEAAAEIDNWVGCDLLANKIRSKAEKLRAGEVE